MDGRAELVETPSRAFYRQAMEVLRRGDVPFLVGGAFAFVHQAGIDRQTKDLDLFVRPGDVHLNISSPGWAKHAWSNVFAPWNALACVFIYNYTRFDAAALLGQMERCGVTSFCAPPTVWRMLLQADLTTLRTPPSTVVGAGEPLLRKP